MKGTPGGEDVDEGGAVFALPPLSGLVQSPGIAVNQLLTNSFSPTGLWQRQTEQLHSAEHNQYFKCVRSYFIGEHSFSLCTSASKR